ncbi:MAG: shikimate dehydrogenase [Gammaproteobacteria bacterium]|jgi:shikimate 5-dehydrogenase|nr:shikimate dehydrogenase [Gammaproteobacteria bacterium]
MSQSSEPDRYAVIGYPVAHSWSPFIHGMFAKQTNQNITYGRIEAPPENFEREVAAFFQTGGKGLNVTVPHKQVAVLIARYRTPRAEMAGAVNTLMIQDEVIHGDNTDGAGLITDLTQNLGFKLADKRILIIGAGGAARGILGPLLSAGPEYVEITNRNADRAVHLAGEFAALGNLRGCGFDEVTESRPFDLVINATSASLQDLVPPVPRSIIGDETLAYDLAYGKGDTAFTRWAKSLGAARAESGWGMLVEQAAESFFWWRGVRPDTKPVLEAIKTHKK